MRDKTRQRQRQRLIDACISALHIYGPSRTTVEKVVALADLSPGIVRFYFDSKAAMLVASLEYLAAEFEERVMVPVARLKDSPVQALRQLVELYLDAEIASPRKVSVWYAFWGEATARQEYQDICGKKDDDFAALVRELMQRLIARTGASHLDADAVALGLIGVLEVLWQGIAFQSEANIDRPAAVRRSLHYLRSLFPTEFADLGVPPPQALPVGQANGRLPAGAYHDAALLEAERMQLLRPAWQLLGHVAELRRVGDFLTAELAGERALVVRAERGHLHVFRNSCRHRPHALLTERKGHLRTAIHCAAHSLTYRFDGHLVAGATPGDLTPLEMMLAGPLIFARLADGMAMPAVTRAAWQSIAALVPRGVEDLDVAADWKLLVEQWLESPQPQQQFVAPNLLIERHPEAAVILQVTPLAPARSRLQRFDFVSRAASRGRHPHAARLRAIESWLRQQVELAESTQAGLSSAAGEPLEGGPVVPALMEFRAGIAALLHALPGAEHRPV